MLFECLMLMHFCCCCSLPDAPINVPTSWQDFAVSGAQLPGGSAGCGLPNPWQRLNHEVPGGHGAWYRDHWWRQPKAGAALRLARGWQRGWRSVYEQVTISAMFLEGWDTSAFFGMVVVRRKHNRKAKCLLTEWTRSNVWVLYRFPSVRMRCYARDTFMPMVAGLIPKNLFCFPLDSFITLSQLCNFSIPKKSV